MEKIPLFQEYRLIEKSESEVKGVWKGAHLLLFFSAFVFGSVCTFCFHMLMYLFDDQCVLFPKFLSLASINHNVIYEFIPEDKQSRDMLPVDFLGTQWVDKRACYLPTYVPLVSGIFGLVWTTMFLMCTTGSRTLTGLQRPWRVMIPVFVFSLAMGSLCIYTSVITQNGLEDLCVKLGELTGITNSCKYTVNVATLAYERRIRGVYQATRMTILAAWMNTCCWLLSAVVALMRMLLAIDFHLVKISVDLVGDIDRMMERHEEQIRTVSPNIFGDDDSSRDLYSSSSELFQGYKTPTSQETRNDDFADDMTTLSPQPTKSLFMSPSEPSQVSKLSLVQEEMKKIDALFISKLLNEIIDKEVVKDRPTRARRNEEEKPSTSKRRGNISFDPPSSTKVKKDSASKFTASELAKHQKKSNLKTASVQTTKTKKKDKKVVITESKSVSPHESDTDSDKSNLVNKETQTPNKEKQD